MSLADQPEALCLDVVSVWVKRRQALLHVLKLVQLDRVAEHCIAVLTRIQHAIAVPIVGLAIVSARGIGRPGIPETCESFVAP